MELQDLFYTLTKSEINVDQNFLKKANFCWVNDEFNMMIKVNEEMMERGQGHIIDKIFTRKLNGENFVVVSDGDEIHIFSYSTKKEMTEILRYCKVFEKKCKFTVISRGKIIDNVRKNKIKVIKESQVVIK